MQLRRWQGAASSTYSAPPRATTKFDVESGQVFQETEVRFNKRQHSDWIGERKTPALLKRTNPNEDGPRSLFDMAKIRVARQVRSLSSEHLADVPWKAAEKIWEEIELTHGESFHAWRIFARAYPEDFNKPGCRYQLEIKQPSLPLPDYFKGITSSAVSWVTSLRISPKQVSTTDLISIAKISNLAVLDLSDGQVTIDNTSSTFNERVMRTWTELADSENAFRHLRVLLIGWQESITTWIFNYLDRFPSLCYLIITDCVHLHQRNRSEWEPIALGYGWSARHAKKSAKSLKPILDDKNFYLGAVSGCYYSSQNIFSQLISNKRPEIGERLPILECSIGTPRTWTHIIDEFPSTRTIWFDNTKTSNSPSEIDEIVETISRIDQIKRSREVETSRTKEVRSPPPKRNQGRVRSKQNARSAVSLLAEFTGKEHGLDDAKSTVGALQGVLAQSPNKTNRTM